jgi:thiamine biosynthesis lipoprotein
MRLGSAGGRRTLVSPETLRLIVAMRDACVRTSGVVDASVLPEVVARGGARSRVDATATTVLPPDARRGPLDEVDVEADAGAVTLPSGLVLDAGGFGKGLAADLAVELLMAAGAAGALVEVDGDLRVAGDAPEPHGWVVEVEDPFAPGTSVARIAIDAGGIATSSTLRHRWTSPDGPLRGTVHHLVGPASSVAPPDDEPATVTVVTGSGVEAEVLAKLPILLGERLGVARLLDLDPSAAALLVRPDRTTTTAGVWPVEETEGAA